MDFETVVRRRIPILTIVLNDGTMAPERSSTTVAEERYSALTKGGDYATVARGLGACSGAALQSRGTHGAVRSAS